MYTFYVYSVNYSRLHTLYIHICLTYFVTFSIYRFFRDIFFQFNPYMLITVDYTHYMYTCLSHISSYLSHFSLQTFCNYIFSVQSLYINCSRLYTLYVHIFVTYFVILFVTDIFFVSVFFAVQSPPKSLYMIVRYNISTSSWIVHNAFES